MRFRHDNIEWVPYANDDLVAVESMLGSCYRIMCLDDPAGVVDDTLSKQTSHL